MFQNFNLTVFLAILAIVLVIYYATLPAAQGVPVMKKEEKVQIYDLGMYDFPDPNAFGVVSGPERHDVSSVRPEFSKDPFPLAEGCTDCDAKGVPNPAQGMVHVSKCGFPSKRMIDAYGGSHFSLPHMSSPCGGALEEPSQLGRFWTRKGCSDPASVGLDLRPSCSRCGN
jgi:hypothetical protein